MTETTRNDEHEAVSGESGTPAGDAVNGEPLEEGTYTAEGIIDSTAGSELEKMRAELASVRDKLLRQVAEFDNFRRRTRDEQSQLIKYGNEGLLLDLLPVLDDFDRSLQAGQSHQDFESFYKGIELLRAKLYSTLERRGLKPIETAGQKFDEAYHEALLQIPQTGKEPGAIIDEAEKGYMLYDKVSRPSKVTVAAECRLSYADAAIKEYNEARLLRGAGAFPRCISG